jgi:hypothetical protein
VPVVNSEPAAGVKALGVPVVRPELLGSVVPTGDWLEFELLPPQAAKIMAPSRRKEIIRLDFFNIDKDLLSRPVENLLIVKRCTGTEFQTCCFPP